MELALPQIAKIIQTSQFIYQKCKKKSEEIRKAAVKNEFIKLGEHIFRAFPSLPKEIVSRTNVLWTGGRFQQTPSKPSPVGEVFLCRISP